MSDLIPLLYQALASSHGLAVEGDDVNKLVAALYAARTRAADPLLAGLSFQRSPNNPGEVWIIHGNHKYAKRKRGNEAGSYLAIQEGLG